MKEACDEVTGNLIVAPLEYSGLDKDKRVSMVPNVDHRSDGGMDWSRQEVAMTDGGGCGGSADIQPEKGMGTRAKSWEMEGSFGNGSGTLVQWEDVVMQGKKAEAGLTFDGLVVGDGVRSPGGECVNPLAMVFPDYQPEEPQQSGVNEEPLLSDEVSEWDLCQINEVAKDRQLC